MPASYPLPKTKVMMRTYAPLMKADKLIETLTAQLDKAKNDNE